MLDFAKNMLINGGYTCVLTDGERKLCSLKRGVLPLVEFLKDGVPSGLYAADKVVGKATAYLYVLLKIKSLFARVISQPALTVLNSYGISVCYDEAVPSIINRAGDGICPFEKCVLDKSEPGEAYLAILEKMKEMGIK